MGYQSTNIIIYGVKLTYEEAKTLEPLLIEGELWCDTADLFVPVDTPPWQTVLDRSIFDPRLLSDETDSRIDSLVLDEGADHYFGIYVGSKGYAYNDNIMQILKNPVPQQVIDNWNKYCQHLFPGKNPEYQMCTQVW